MQLEELGHVICNICNIVPGGIVCFFPSYDYEAKVFDFWSKSGVIRRISSKKKVRSFFCLYEFLFCWCCRIRWVKLCSRGKPYPLATNE